MKTRTLPLVLLLCLSWGLAGAQTNVPAAKPVEQELDISADSGYFDGITNQMVYLGHVFVIYNVKDTLHCERLTVDLPADHGNPTNIVAETNVVVDVLDDKGQTNHVTADMAVYSYQLLNPVTNVLKNVTNVVYAVTNEFINFYGTNPIPQLERPDAVIKSDVIKIDVMKRGVSYLGPHFETKYRQTPRSGNSTNASPFGFPH
jgi:lipopolysaccharide export system protein LptA